MIHQLADCRWVAQHLNILITGPTGVGKSYLAWALAQKACRDGYKAFYQRLPRLLVELEIARGDGRYPKLMRHLSKVDVLVLDDWGLENGINDSQRRDLLEILDDRCASHATVVTANCLLSTGTKRSATPRWPMPSLTGLCTTPIASSCKATPCASKPPRPTTTQMLRSNA